MRPAAPALDLKGLALQAIEESQAFHESVLGVTENVDMLCGDIYIFRHGAKETVSSGAVAAGASLSTLTRRAHRRHGAISIRV